MSIKPLVYVVDKPVGMTSYDVIRHFKRNLPRNFGKIGHFGTLDPFASGILLVAVGGASRLNDYVHQYLPKTYVAKGELGASTPTGDMTSSVSSREEEGQLKDRLQREGWDRDSLQRLLSAKLEGEYWQAPPAYSAAKFQGQSLHKWARMGVQVEKPPVQRKIHKLEVLEFDFPFVTIRAKVSSGTYIRTLFEDVAKELGTIGVLHTLRREEIGHIHGREALAQMDWPQAGKTKEGLPWEPGAKGWSLERIFPLAKLVLEEQESTYFLQGKKINGHGKAMSGSENFIDGLPLDKFWVFSASDGILGMGQIDGDFCSPMMNFPR